MKMRKELADKEVDNLNRLATDYMLRVQKELSRLRKQEVKLYLTEKDRYLLLTWKIWEQRYLLSTRSLVNILVPFWERFIEKHSRRIAKRKNLGSRVSTLVGKKSEMVLVEELGKLYPNNQHK